MIIAVPSLLASLAGGGRWGMPVPIVTVISSGAGTGASESAGSPQALNVPSSTDTSLNWSGYDATGGSFTSVGAGWNVPDSSAASSSISADATWVGIGGVTRTDLIQAGTQAVFQNGSVSYQAWYEMLPASSIAVPLTIHAGDAMTVSITESSAGVWQISFLDSTTGQSYTTSVNYDSSLSSAEWVEEAPSDQQGFVPLDSFGSVSFTDAFAVENGSRVTIAGANGQPMTMITSGGAALSTPSSIGSDGASFTITRTDVPSAAQGQGYVIGSGSGRGRWSRVGVGVRGYASPQPAPVSVQSNGRGFGFFSGRGSSFFIQFRNQF
jgi:hypothetical protein